MPLPIKLFIKFSVPLAVFLICFLLLSNVNILTAIILSVCIGFIYGIIMTIILLSLMVNSQLPVRGWHGFLAFGIPFGTWMGITFWVDAWVNFKWKVSDSSMIDKSNPSLDHVIYFTDQGEIWTSIILSSIASCVFFGLLMPPISRQIIKMKQKQRK